jgi:hypothetical protein
MTWNRIFKQTKKQKFQIFFFFSIFPKSCDFTGFAMDNRLYLKAEMTNFNSKTKFGKFIRFYYEVYNKKIQFDIIIVVYGGPGVDRRWKISNLGQMFHSKKIKYRGPYDHIWFNGKLMVSFNGIIWKIQDF